MQGYIHSWADNERCHCTGANDYLRTGREWHFQEGQESSNVMHIQLYNAPAKTHPSKYTNIATIK